MISRHEQSELDLIMQEFNSKCLELDLQFTIYTHQDCFCYEIISDTSYQRGIFYILGRYKNADFEAIDSIVFELDLVNRWLVNEKTITNTYVCPNCKILLSAVIIVHFTFSDIETFCLHLPYIDDELEIFSADDI